MNSHDLLNHRDHLNTKVISYYSESLGDSVNCTMVFPIEFRNVQSHYPILLKKNNETGNFYPVALLGFENIENLFLDGNNWDANYVPLMMQKQPFFIGLQDDKDAIDGKAMVVTVDSSSPRVSEVEGERLFNDDGSPTEFLQGKMDVLEHVHQGNEHSERFVQALLDHDLLEAFTLEVTLETGSTNQLLGFYTINEEAVQRLSGASLEALSKEGFLMSIFMILASHSRVTDLVERKNRLNRSVV